MKQNKTRDTDRQNPKSNPIFATIINLIFEVVKHFLHDINLTRTASKQEDASRRFDELKDANDKLETKLDKCLEEIKELNYKMLWANILFIVVLITLVAQIVIIIR